MLLKAPAFWYFNRLSWQSLLLAPIGFIYSALVKSSRLLVRSCRLPVPVVSIGNITVGGMGKTPLSIALARSLTSRGMRVAVLLRGYGRNVSSGFRVQSKHCAADVGDEALEYRDQLPEAHVWVGRDRVAIGRAAIAAGAQLLLLDDGLQHWCLARDCDISVLDKMHGLGNGLVFPAGPLREPLNQLGRADFLVLMGATARRYPLIPWPADKPQFDLASWIEPPANLIGRPLVAFCGIGLPKKFFAAVQHAGLRVIKTYDFPDHYPYSEHDLRRMHDYADEHHATLITTVKDWQRLSQRWRQHIVALPLGLDHRAVEAIADAVLQSLGGRSYA